jgi:hypothetical protein
MKCNKWLFIYINKLSRVLFPCENQGVTLVALGSELLLHWQQEPESVGNGCKVPWRQCWALRRLSLDPHGRDHKQIQQNRIIRTEEVMMKPNKCCSSNAGDRGKTKGSGGPRNSLARKSGDLPFFTCVVQPHHETHRLGSTISYHQPLGWSRSRRR